VLRKYDGKLVYNIAVPSDTSGTARIEAEARNRFKEKTPQRGL
jgi:hypothetical protein